jgi:hypothetical protein
MNIENRKYKRMKTFSVNTNKKFSLGRIEGFLLLLMLAFFSAIPASAQNVSVEAKIDSTVIFVGQQTGFHLGVTVKEGQNVQFPKFEPLQHIIPGIEVVETLPSDTQKLDDGYLRISAHYTLTSFDDTLYYIPSVKVKVNNKEYESKSLALKVLTVKVDTLHPNQFLGPKDVQDNPFLWDEWSRVLWLSAAAFVLFIIALLMFMRLKSEKPIVFKVKIIKRVPAHQKALNSIEEIKSKSTTVTADDAKAYYTHLTDTLRRYMMERFGFNAMEMTSAEIISRLRQEEDQTKINELTILFETADLVKFAKYSVGVNENDHNLISAIDFINTTKQENAPTEERIEPTVTEKDKQTIRNRKVLKWTLCVVALANIALLVYVVWELILLCF